MKKIYSCPSRCQVMRNPLCLSQGSGLDNDDEKVEIIMKPINKTQ